MLSLCIPKGQEISEWIYEVFALPKIWTEKFEKFCPFSNFFVHILGNATTSYIHSEISWPSVHDFAFLSIFLQKGKMFIHFKGIFGIGTWIWIWIWAVENLGSSHHASVVNGSIYCRVTWMFYKYLVKMHVPKNKYICSFRKNSTPLCLSQNRNAMTFPISRLPKEIGRSYLWS